MKQVKSYEFEVETIESGQRRAYGDSYYHYIVKSQSSYQLSEFEVEKFCRNVLSQVPIKQSEVKEHVEKEGFGGNFTPYMTLFRKIDENKYEYKYTRTSTH